MRMYSHLLVLPYKSFNAIALTLLCLSLSSCGFHLRGQVELPDEISPLYLDAKGENNLLLRELSALLQQPDKNNLADSEAMAKARLYILSARQLKRVVSVDSRGRAREYELTYWVRYGVTLMAAESLTENQTEMRELKLKRDLLFDPDSVLAVSHEQDALFKAMLKDSARLILEQLKSMHHVTAESVAE